jgi:hypothetical protein
MANKKITDLTELTAAASNDYLEIVDTSANASKKITRENLIGFAGTWQSYTPSLSWSGGTTNPTSATFDYAKYMRIGKMVTVQIKLTVKRGSGNRTYATIGLPINASVHGLAGTGVEDLTSALRQPFNVSSYAYNAVTAYLPSAMSRDGSIHLTFTYPIA